MINEFENVRIKGIHISRYVASWYNVDGKWTYFRKWLSQLVIDGEHLTEDEIRRIIYFAANGKMELEQNARNFINECSL